MGLGPIFGGIWGPFFGPIFAIFVGAHFQPPENPVLNGDFRFRLKKLDYKNASTSETLKTRVRPRFVYQKIDCSRDKGLKMAQNWDPNPQAFSIR